MLRQGWEGTWRKRRWKRGRGSRFQAQDDVVAEPNGDLAPALALALAGSLATSLANGPA